MISQKKYKTLIWIIAILLATNIATISSFQYHRIQEIRQIQETENTEPVLQNEQRVRFFREQLNLDEIQTEKFRNYNRDFNQKARNITRQMDFLRLEMVNEIGKEDIDNELISQITNEIGKLHTDLKNLTVEYYLQMKQACNSQQCQNLNQVFKSIIVEDENINAPGRMQNRRQSNIN